ncbi:MAG: DUF1559 domain-containing protein [Armatimonadetes bacterium]|nr:DUF1559 domain-containing protein [Candidatus Hippobium faecium]
MFKKGFTLIELLVVIAIIAILAAILFPVFAPAREKARQSSCLSNTKQIGTALQLYVDDYDETFPNMCPWGHTWDVDDNGTMTQAKMNTVVGALWPYIKNGGIFCCPSAKKDGSKTSTRLTYVSYLWNGAIIGRLGDNVDAVDGGGMFKGAATMAEITRPSEIFINSEMNTASTNTWQRPLRWDAIVLNADISLTQEIHNGGQNHTFCDGHAKFMKSSQATVGNYGVKWSDGDRNHVASDWTTQWLNYDL